MNAPKESEPEDVAWPNRENPNASDEVEPCLYPIDPDAIAFAREIYEQQQEEFRRLS